jgi:hypothetical protein
MVHFPAQKRDFSLIQNAHQTSYVMDMWLFAEGYSSQGMKLATHFHLELRLTMHGGISPLPNMPSWHADKLLHFTLEYNARILLKF